MINYVRGLFLSASLSMAATSALSADAQGYLKVMANGKLTTEHIETDSSGVCIAQAFGAATTTKNLEFAYINCVDRDGEYLGSQTCTVSECLTRNVGEPAVRFGIDPS